MKHPNLTIQSQEQKDKNLTGENLMIIPIRCWSCGKPIAHFWEEFKERLAKGEERKDILDELKVERYCCRSVFLGHIDLIDTAGEFKKV